MNLGEAAAFHMLPVGVEADQQVQWIVVPVEDPQIVDVLAKDQGQECCIVLTAASM